MIRFLQIIFIFIALNLNANQDVFTSQEKEWIKNNTIKVGVEQWTPVVYMNKNNTTITVCILAYNEQTHIADTIKHIIEGNKDVEYTLKVYANGCTDDTVKIVKELETVYPNLVLRDLEIASKPQAWNTAFHENKDDILMFSDADIILEAGSIKSLANSLDKNNDFIAATAQYTPLEHGLSFEKKFTGYMQLPIDQEYLTGHFYALKELHLLKYFLNTILMVSPKE